MSDQPEPQSVGVFDVWEQDDDDDLEEALIGRVEYDDTGRLAMLDAEPARRDYLQTAIDRVNGKPAITRMVGPGPDAPQFAVGSETIERGSEQFAAALQEHLVKYFGLRLG